MMLMFFHPERNSISINDKNIEQDPGDKSYVKWTPSGGIDFDNALYKNIVKSAYVATITHEVGHAVDYSRNLQSASSGYLTTTDKNLKKELANFLKVLSESKSEYNSENTYALKNSIELFAEYYTYTYASDPLTSKGFFPYLESKKCPKILREAWQKLKVQFDEIIANNNK